MWNLLKCAFDLRSTPATLDVCFSGWIKTFPKQDKKMVLVGIAAMFWSLWRSRNDICFNRRNVTDPMTIVKMMCAWIADWSFLQIKEPKSRMLTVGARLLEQVASEAFRASQGWRPGVLRLGDRWMDFAAGEGWLCCC